MRSIALFIALAAGLVCAHPAKAESLSVSYSDAKSGLSFTAILDGAVQKDQNSFAIDAVDSFSYVVDPRLMPGAGPEASGSWNLSTVLGADYFWFAQFGDKPQGVAYGTVTLDGSYMDFTACGDAQCKGNSISILAGDLFDDSISKFDTGLKNGAPVMIVSLAGNTPLTFNSAFWYAAPGTSGTQASQNAGAKPGAENVPEPPAIALFGIGLIGLAALRRNGRG